MVKVPGYSGFGYNRFQALRFQVRHHESLQNLGNDKTTF